jgi:5-methylcytosine-specific restriction protein A
MTLYDTTNWKRLRRRKLAGVPYCEACNAIGRLVPATVVDHVVAVSAGGPMYPSLDQLMSVCAPCHNSKTRRVEQGGLPNVITGCDANGLPVDASHPFYGAKPVYPLAGPAIEPRRARVPTSESGTG